MATKKILTDLHIDGKVGIGTDSISAKLDVRTANGNTQSLRIGRLDTASYWNFNHAGNDLRIYNDGGTGQDILLGVNSGGTIYDNKVGIGTATPSAKLHLYVNSANDDTFHIFNGSVRTHLLASESSNGVIYMRNSANSNTIRINASGNSYLNGGNVGIGTTSPNFALDVNGDIRIEDTHKFFLGGSGGTADWFTQATGTGLNFAENGVADYRLFLKNGGNVGIGTDNPGYKLDVSGNIRTNSNLYIYNSDLSKQSLRVHSEATTNTGILKLSNGNNWGLLMKGVGNGPYVGSYHSGSFNITGFEDSTGTSPSATNLAQFSFGGSGGSNGYLKLNGDLKVNNNKKIQLSYSNSQTNGIEWYHSTKVSASIIPVDTANFARTGLGFFTGDYSDGTTNADERMRITRAGNVGIGTTNPSDKLEVDEGFITATGAGTSHGFRLERGSLNTYSLRHLDGGFTVYNDTDARKEMSFDGAGNVGIGTTAPGEKLEVSGNIKLSSIGTGNSANSYGMLFYGTTSSGTQTDQAKIHSSPWASNSNGGNLQLYTSNASNALTERMRIDGAGNVGIGTNSPTQLLHVNSTTSNPTGIGLQNNQRYYSVRSNNYSLVFTDETVGAERMRIDNNGNVGIGTTTPGNKLDINSGTANSALRVLSTDRYTGIKFEDATNNDTLFYDGQSDLMYLGSTSFRAVDIYATGNVGIGTTSPDRQLEVSNIGNAIIRIAGDSDNDVGEAGDAVLEMTTDGGGQGWAIRSANIGGGTGDFKVNTLIGGTESNKLLIDKDGNVGIGTTNPDRPLSVVGGNSMVARFQSTNTTAFIQLSNTVSTADQVRVGSNGTNLVLSTNYAERLRILANGNVGIGTTTPANKLDVVGNVSVSSLRVGSSASGEGIIRYNPGGGNGIGITTGALSSSGIGLFVSHGNTNRNVGIGTTSPSAKLDVDGGIKMADDTDTASLSKVGTMRYRSDANNSYVDMCMQTGVSTYEWINIVQNNF